MPPTKYPNFDTRKTIFEAVPGLEICETLFESITDLRFCMKNRSGCYIAANSAFTSRVGLRNRTELLGKSASDIFPAILATGYEQQDQEVFTTGTPIIDHLEMSTQANGNIGWFITQKLAIQASGKVIALVGVSRDLDTPIEQSQGLGPLGEAINTIQVNSSEPLRMSDLAKMAKLSGSQFTRRVRSVTGLTPRQLLTKARVQSAADDLRQTSLALSEIAVKCGFYDQAAFSRQFRQATGMTPSNYRREFLLT